MPPANDSSSCGNPLLLKWVEEWLEVEQTRNTKGVTTYKRAAASLRACPVMFSHPSEAQQLQHIGEGICKRLTECMEEHCRQNGLPLPVRSRKRAVPIDGSAPDAAGPTKKKPAKAKNYVPKFRSGPYALLLALSTLRPDEEIQKAGLIDRAQQYCDSSFITPSDPKKVQTAWSSMVKLVERDLVSEKGRPKKYALTEEGWAVVEAMKKTGDHDNARLDSFVAREQVDSSRAPEGGEREGTVGPSPKQEDIVGIIPAGTEVSSTSSLPHFTPIVLQPGRFTVELVLDMREVHDKRNRSYIQDELYKEGVNPIMRALELGDCLWIAKVTDPEYRKSLGLGEDAFMLDYIIERKRLTDFIESIKDGRFNEQKFRLKRSGVKNIIYVVEDCHMTPEAWGTSGIMKDRVESSIAAAQVVEGFFVRRTPSIDHTVRYLKRMTLMLKRMYEKEPLHLIPTNVLTMHNYMPILDNMASKHPSTSYHISYPAFASMATKSDARTLRDIYLRMLMCTRGVTGEKAVEIQKIWPTPNALLVAYEEIDSHASGAKRKAEMVATATDHLIGRKKVGKATSLKLAESWGVVCEDSAAQGLTGVVGWDAQLTWKCSEAAVCVAKSAPSATMLASCMSGSSRTSYSTNRSW